MFTEAFVRPHLCMNAAPSPGCPRIALTAPRAAFTRSSEGLRGACGALRQCATMEEELGPKASEARAGGWDRSWELRAWR